MNEHASAVAPSPRAERPDAAHVGRRAPSSQLPSNADPAAATAQWIAALQAALAEGDTARARRALGHARVYAPQAGREAEVEQLAAGHPELRVVSAPPALDDPFGLAATPAATPAAAPAVQPQGEGAHAPPQAAHAPPVAGGDPHAFAQRFPQGITVAIALVPDEDPGPAAGRLRAGNPTLGALLRRLGPQLLGSLPQVQRLRAALAAGDHPLTEAESLDVASALAANDRAFRRGATDFAAGHQVVGGEGAPVVGQPILFHHNENAVAKIRAVSAAVGALPGAQGAGNIRHLAIFTHGWHSGLQLGAFHGGAAAFVGQLSDTLTHDVTVGMYACSAASGDNSFAEQVTEALAERGHDVRVFGHETAAHTTTNARGREFRAHAGEHEAHGARNSELVFAADFHQAEVTRLAGELGVDHAAVEGVFARASERWLNRSMARIRVPGGRVASYHIGFDPDAAVQACRTAWRSEGAEVIRAALAHP